MKTIDTKIYEANEKAKDTAFKLVPDANHKGYKKACAVYDYIRTGKGPVKFASRTKEQKLKMARQEFVRATV